MLAQLTYAHWVQILEAAMMVCFGFGWPIDVIKTLRTKQVEGKSIGFMSMIFVGYLAGMSSKFVKLSGSGTLEDVTALYAFNAVMVGIDIALYFRYRRAGDKPVPGRVEV
ncbi:MAG: hypothetical protein ACOCWV_05935 [Planctomycetota bacterium]